MLRRTFLIVLAASAAPLACADWPGWGSLTGSGVLRREAREVAPFTGISLSLPATVEITLGDRETVEVEADDKLLAGIETVVERGSLQVRFRDKVNFARSREIKVLVTARRIDALAISGTGDIHAAVLKADSLSARISGSGDIRIAQLDAGSVKVAISGSGDFSAGGKADSLEASIAGSGDLKTARLDTKRASISIAGSGDARVWVREKLAVSVAGSGDIRYYGDPAISKSVLGSGTLTRLGAAPG
jgi:hypothetical protein